MSALNHNKHRGSSTRRGLMNHHLQSEMNGTSGFTPVTKFTLQSRDHTTRFLPQAERYNADSAHNADIAAASSLSTIGLEIKPSIPAARQRSSSLDMAWAVKAMIGVLRPLASRRRISCVACNPSRSEE